MQIRLRQELRKDPIFTLWSVASGYIDVGNMVTRNARWPTDVVRTQFPVCLPQEYGALDSWRVGGAPLAGAVAYPVQERWDSFEDSKVSGGNRVDRRATSGRGSSVSMCPQTQFKRAVTVCAASQQ